MKAICWTLAVSGMAVVAYLVLSPLRESPAATAEVNVPYLCRETKQLVFAPPGEVPAVNPATGRATLQRALYCGQCRRWHAVPSPDAYPGNPLGYRCPKHRMPMTTQGPKVTSPSRG